MENNLKVEVIPATRHRPGILKVGIYARVSTARATQLRSLSAQASLLTQYVYQRNDMLLRDVYMDVGSAKTGASRMEFSRLIQDCKSRKLDYVIVKSMSRFGRDVVEIVESIRLLQGAGVKLYFYQEKSEIDPSSEELETSLEAAIIQSENEHRSENIKIGLKHKAENGTNGLYRKPCYGYKKDGNGNLTLDIYQSTVVQHIFELYLAGNSEAAIIEDLAEKKIMTPRGKERWCKKAIETILTNEKYTGNVIILKSDVNRASYCMSNAHEAIITQEIFDKAQEEMNRRAKRKKKRIRVKA